MAAERINMRSGPGINYQVLDVVQEGERFQVIARNSDGSWLRICCVADEPGWVYAELVTVEGDLTADRRPLTADRRPRCPPSIDRRPSSAVPFPRARYLNTSMICTTAISPKLISKGTIATSRARLRAFARGVVEAVSASFWMRKNSSARISTSPRPKSVFGN